MKSKLYLLGLIFIIFCFFINFKVYADNLTNFILIPSSGTINSFYIGKYPVTNYE